MLYNIHGNVGMLSVFQMWACALGHQRAAELLYGWNSLALGIPDSLGRLPLAVARSRGHTRLASALEGLHVNHPTSQTTPPSDTQTLSTDAQTPATPQPQLPLSPLSTSPDTGEAPHQQKFTVIDSLI